MPLPDPKHRHPIILPNGQPHEGTVQLARVVENPNFIVGDYTYASDFTPPQDWGSHLAPYLFPGARERLCKRWCQQPRGCRALRGAVG